MDDKTEQVWNFFNNATFKLTVQTKYTVYFSIGLPLLAQFLVVIFNVTSDFAFRQKHVACIVANTTEPNQTVCSFQSNRILFSFGELPELL